MLAAERLRDLERAQADNDELERRLAVAARIDAVGRLAGGVAHDFNNVLTIVLSGIGLLTTLSRHDERSRRVLGQMEAAADRAAALTRQLLAVGGRQPLTLGPVYLNDTVTGFAPMLRSLLPEDTELILALEPGLPCIVGDHAKLERVLLNLVANARDALPRGGSVTIRSRLVSGGVELAVLDDGVGMAAATRERLFEPFFTTKASGDGTGLGLATVYGIVRQHAGAIDVESELGAGACFRLTFPVVAEAHASPSTADPGPAVARGHEAVLLVEDDALLRRLTCAVLEDSGYRVTEADGPGAALAAIDRGEHFDLLVADVVMPGMSGGELGRTLRAREPGLRLLYMSGHGVAAIEQRGVCADAAELLAKPFAPGELLGRVRAALDRAPPGEAA